MKKILTTIIATILLLSLALSFTACGKSQPKEISCEQIIAAYEAAGYYVSHGQHTDTAGNLQDCYIKANISNDPDSDYIYFQVFPTEEQAKQAHKTDKYHIAVWLYATVCGESRWLKTGTYGKIEYSTYNSKLLTPFNELTK